MEEKKILRCVIYVRKSHENGLEQAYNSLDAQREAGENYIASQKMNGWQLLPEHYDDGGFSGGNMERPALKRMLTDVEAGKIDIIVVYKLDRLSRSLLDFMKLAEMLEQHNVSFVSVTQDINTSTSSGRMMLNILMAFGQYEMEILADRVRDKIAGAKRRGKHCGGYPVLGYDSNPDTKKLFINEEEAKVVRLAFTLYCRLGSAKRVAQELNKKGLRTKLWKTRKGEIHQSIEFKPDTIYRMLNNQLYIGKMPHKENIYQGEHEAIIDMELWEKAKKVTDATCNAKGFVKQETASPFKGLLKCGYCGGALGITYTRKKNRRYTYYFCVKDSDRALSECPIVRIPAGDTDKIIFQQMAAVFRTPSLLAQAYFEAAKIENEKKMLLSERKAELDNEMKTIRERSIQLFKNDPQDSEALALSAKLQETGKEFSEIEIRLRPFERKEISAKDINESFNSIENLWNELFPAERYRLMHLLVEKITVFKENMRIELKTRGMDSLVQEISNAVSQGGDDKNCSASVSETFIVNAIRPEIQADGNIILNIPIRMKYKEGRKVIIAPDAIDGEVPDAVSPVKAPLAQAIARAHAWFNLIATGKIATVTQLADKLKLDHSYVSRTLRLVNIAPDITESIISGDENLESLSLKSLRMPIPADWREQRQILGIGR